MSEPLQPGLALGSEGSVFRFEASGWGSPIEPQARECGPHEKLAPIEARGFYPARSFGVGRLRGRKFQVFGRPDGEIPAESQQGVQRVEAVITSRAKNL